MRSHILRATRSACQPAAASGSRVSQLPRRALIHRAAHTGATCPPPAEAAQIGAGIGRLSNMVVDRGQGSWVWSEDGEKYLDFATGIGVLSLGHCHPKVSAAVHAQVDKIWHAQVNITNSRPMFKLVEALKTAMPKDSGLDSFLFVTTGAEAVEAAVKLARHATKKPNIICFQGIHISPLPYFLGHHATVEDPAKLALAQLELLMQQQTTPEETAAVVIEPVLGEGGYVPPPAGFLEGLREFCDKKGILLIADEVQSGFGRTGKMFAVEHYGVKPDIMIFAKGIATGMPIAGIASRKELMDKQPAGSQGGTYAGNAVACAAAEATIGVMHEEKILANVEARGKQLMDALLGFQKEGVAPIQDVRGLGLMIGVEFDNRVVEKGFATKVAKAAMSHGLIILPTGGFETMRLIPPLNVSAEECETGLKLFKQALVDAQK